MTSRFSNPDSDFLLPSNARRTATESPEADQPEVAAALPRSIYIPEGYEPNYAYPLIVWIQVGTNGSPTLQHVMPGISDRNYIGLSLTLETEDAEADLEKLEKLALKKVQALRREWHTHSERVYLAGYDVGGTLALRLGLARPEWFAGIMAIGAHYPASRHTLRRFRDLRNKRVLLAVGSRDRKVSLQETVETSRLLHAAGMRVSTRVYDAGHQITRPMLRDLDGWIMQEICAPQTV